ncbi:MAG: aspartate aminotransferase family protein [Halalkalicoccus sp.]
MSDERGSNRSVVERARRVIPGGAQTGLRAQAYDLGEIAFAGASGATLETVAGESLADYHLAFGPIVLGHGRPEVDEAVRATIEEGVLYGAATTPLEVEVAERIVDLVPSAELVNFCNSGTEATYHAIRLARAYTGDDRLIKFEGCYHGWHDYVDIGVYPPSERVGEKHPESAGMLPEAVEHTEVLPFNDSDAVEEAFEALDDVAAVICEPIPHSVGCLLPEMEFLETLRGVTAENDVPLIFDEVITGFRHSVGGIQSEFGVTPDLTCLAKAMGNGYPVAAVCGREELVGQAGGDNTSGVVISGTYSGHPVGLAAARETMRLLEAEPVTEGISALGERYREGLEGLFEMHGIEGRVVGYGSVFAPQFGVTGEPRHYEDVLGLDEAAFAEFARGMRERGHFFTPNPYKRQHLSWAHGEAELEAYLAAADRVLGSLSMD